MVVQINRKKRDELASSSATRNATPTWSHVLLLVQIFKSSHTSFSKRKKCVQYFLCIHRVYFQKF